MKFWKSFSKQCALGLALASVLVAILGYNVVKDTQRELLRQHAERGAMMQAIAIADMVAGATKRGSSIDPVEGVNLILDQWSLNHFEVNSIRVIKMRGRKLLATTAMGDFEVGEPPRKLVRDEKWLFDLGNELTTAYKTNREEGSSRKKEVILEYLDDGLVRISAPYIQSRKVTGFIQLEAYLNIPEKEVEKVPFILIGIVPLLVFIILSQTPFFTREENTKAMTRFVIKPFIFSAILLGIASSMFVYQNIENYSSKRGIWERNLSENWYLQKEEVKQIFDLLGVDDSFNSNRAYSLSRLYIQQRHLDDDAPERKDEVINSDIDVEVLTEIEKQQTHGVKKWFIFVVCCGAALFLFFAAGWATRLWLTLLKYRSAYTYVAPAMISMLVLVFFPFIYGITLSFTDQNIYNQNQGILDIWVGFANYADILKQIDVFTWNEDGMSINFESFYWTLFITVCWTVFNVIIGVSLGLILALALNVEGLKGKPIYRVLLILPWAIPNYITALIWRAMFHQQFGAVNQVLQMFGGEPIAWFDNVFSSFITGLACNGWLSFPFMMVICLGALQSIDKSMYEAARLDGATRMQQFRFVTMPALKPTLVPAIILSVVWTFNMFNVIFLVSNGQPAGSNEILITKAYKIAFEQYRYGYAAAYSTIIFFILVIYGIFQNKMSKASEGV